MPHTPNLPQPLYRDIAENPEVYLNRLQRRNRERAEALKADMIARGVHVYTGRPVNKEHPTILCGSASLPTMKVSQ